MLATGAPNLSIAEPQYRIFDDPENGFRVQNLTLDELANILNKQRDLIRLTIGLFAAADCKHIARAAVPKIVPLLTKITAIELKARDDECEAFHLAAMLISQNRQIIEDLVIKAGDVDGLPDPVGYPQTLEHLEDHYNDLTPHPTLSLPFQNLKSSSSSALYWGLAEDSWLALFGCTTLQSLRLRNRDQVSTFLEQLAEAYRATGTCNLRTLEITWNMDVISEPIAIRQALHELLLTFKGLRRLFIVSHCSETNASVVSLPAVLRHAATLESLIIEEIDRKPFTTDTMGDLCRKCPNLRHLGLDLPLSDADATLGGGEFGQYLVRIPKVKTLTLLISSRPPLAMLVSWRA